jgi:hypothetical protein
MALVLGALLVGLFNTARADAPVDQTGVLASLWGAPQDDGKLNLVLVGTANPVATSIADATMIKTVCLDCGLPLEFKACEAGKNCMVCGCQVSNAACLVGKPVKANTLLAALKMLPRGTVLHITFTDPAKPESGIQKLSVDLRHVLLPVSGLDGQTPDQLLELVKPLGGKAAELVDSGKRLSVLLKSDWTIERETKLETAITGVNGKVIVPDAPKPAQ